MKKVKKEKLWGQKSSVFRTVLFVLSFFLAAMLAYLTYYTTKVTVQRQKKEVDSSNLRILEQTSEAMDRFLMSEVEKITLLLCEEEVITFLFRPESLSPDNSYQILQELSYLEGSNSDEESNQLWFYSRQADELFGSDGYREQRKGSGIESLLDFHDSRESQWKWLDSDLKQDIFLYEGDLYLTVDFVPSHSVGTIVVKISETVLDSIFSGDGGDNSGISVFDEEGIQVYPLEQRGETVSEELLSGKACCTSVSQKSRSSMKWYRYTSDSIGWNYAMNIAMNSRGLSLKDLFLGMLPCLIVVLLLGLVSSYFITLKIYEPIDRLMTMAMGNKRNRSLTMTDEVNFLETEYRKQQEERQEMSRVMDLVSAEMISQFCRNLLKGRNMPEDYQNSVMAVAGFAKQEEQRFIVMVIELEGEQKVFRAPVESNLFFMSVKNFLENEPEYISMVVMDDREVAAVFQFSQNFSVTEATKRMREMQEGLMNLFHSVACQAKVSTGHLYPRIQDIRFSYEEAREKLRYQIYMEKDKGNQGEQEEISGNLEQQRYDYGRIMQILQNATDGKVTEAKKMAVCLLKEILEEDSVENGESRCILIRDMLIEKLLFYRMDKEENQTLLSTLDFPMPPIRHQEEWKNGIVRIIDQIACCSGKKQYQYIEQAKKYITEHFMESTMTVNDVSDYIGIHVSYFSSLFNEIMNESFSSYLNRIRVEHARDMLTMTKISVKDVGFKCGFNTVQTFGRVFKKYTSMSPGQYRDFTRKEKSE
ncbi:MAG: helix-turn-helix domain-containing protein [Clostridiales bacterium]|nr:helix-turn-helix domain-containing protein [Clostridiales bacterium]